MEMGTLFFSLSFTTELNPEDVIDDLAGAWGFGNDNG